MRPTDARACRFKISIDMMSMLGHDAMSITWHVSTGHFLVTYAGIPAKA